MIGILISFLVIGVITLVAPMLSVTYGSQLERYIVSHEPKDVADVERLTLEFQEKQTRNFI